MHTVQLSFSPLIHVWLGSNWACLIYCRKHPLLQRFLVREVCAAVRHGGMISTYRPPAASQLALYQIRVSLSWKHGVVSIPFPLPWDHPQPASLLLLQRNLCRKNQNSWKIRASSEKGEEIMRNKNSSQEWFPRANIQPARSFLFG